MAKAKAKGMSTGGKVAIGVGVVLLLGGITWFIISKNKKKKNEEACTKAGGTYDHKTKSCVMPVKEVVKNPPKPFKDAYDNLNFQSGKAIIQPSSYPSLDEVVTVLKAHPNLALQLVGYTDNQGAKQYNIDLSVARANSVKTYLMSKGIADARITTSGKGPANPIATNNTAKGRELNRRVEFIVGKTAMPPVMDQTPSPVDVVTPGTTPGTTTTTVTNNTTNITNNPQAPTPTPTPTPNVPGARPSNLLDFQKWVILVKGDKSILGGGGSTGFGDDGKWGPKSSTAWSKYGTEYVNK